MMKIRTIKSRKSILVDDEDFPVLSRHRWSLNRKENRATAWIDGKNISPGRLILSVQKYQEVDHKNHNPLDNRKKNLRICTRSQNEINKPPSKLNSSGFKGVKKGRNKNGRWQANIDWKRKKIYLGTFDSKEEAARAYNKRAKKLYGDFAWLNPV